MFDRDRFEHGYTVTTEVKPKENDFLGGVICTLLVVGFLWWLFS
jgi:hypothetical protein